LGIGRQRLGARKNHGVLQQTTDITGGVNLASPVVISSILAWIEEGVYE